MDLKFAGALIMSFLPPFVYGLWLKTATQKIRLADPSLFSWLKQVALPFAVGLGLGAAWAAIAVEMMFPSRDEILQVFRAILMAQLAIIAVGIGMALRWLIGKGRVLLAS